MKKKYRVAVFVSLIIFSIPWAALCIVGWAAYELWLLWVSWLMKKLRVYDTDPD